MKLPTNIKSLPVIKDEGKLKKYCAGFTGKEMGFPFEFSKDVMQRIPFLPRNILKYIKDIPPFTPKGTVMTNFFVPVADYETIRDRTMKREKARRDLDQLPKDLVDEIETRLQQTYFSHDHFIGMVKSGVVQMTTGRGDSPNDLQFGLDVTNKKGKTMFRTIQFTFGGFKGEGQELLRISSMPAREQSGKENLDGTPQLKALFPRDDLSQAAFYVLCDIMWQPMFIQKLQTDEGFRKFFDLHFPEDVDVAFKAVNGVRRMKTGKKALFLAGVSAYPVKSEEALQALAKYWDTKNKKWLDLTVQEHADILWKMNEDAAKAKTPKENPFTHFRHHVTLTMKMEDPTSKRSVAKQERQNAQRIERNQAAKPAVPTYLDGTIIREFYVPLEGKTSVKHPLKNKGYDKIVKKPSFDPMNMSEDEIAVLKVNPEDWRAAVMLKTKPKTDPKAPTREVPDRVFVTGSARLWLHDGSYLLNFYCNEMNKVKREMDKSAYKSNAESFQDDLYGDELEYDDDDDSMPFDDSGFSAGGEESKGNQETAQGKSDEDEVTALLARNEGLPDLGEQGTGTAETTSSFKNPIQRAMELKRRKTAGSVTSEAVPSIDSLME